MSKYTKAHAKIVHDMKAPYPGFRMAIVEYPGHVAIRVFEENIAQYTIDMKVGLAEYLYRLRDALKAAGCPCEIEGVTGAPR